jgi:hypothetical protein
MFGLNVVIFGLCIIICKCWLLVICTIIYLIKQIHSIVEGEDE